MNKELLEHLQQNKQTNTFFIEAPKNTYVPSLDAQIIIHGVTFTINHKIQIGNARYKVHSFTTGKVHLIKV